ncbi:hypothetical protein BP6252_08248 [Coleophoma cylindrospora]|uniref:Zn(2)-C6 fungal-type domain-containing protein n=1 Tax=Coleophoma cylindrospora TaxID=1849047 RepID=A0A3D8R5I2_9HELO|nr:hypothetical protein BP6252_08248 [Coleophoma cylindrospora]
MDGPSTEPSWATPDLDLDLHATAPPTAGSLSHLLAPQGYPNSAHPPQPQLSPASSPAPAPAPKAKRPRMEKSRTGMSYPRKRAVTACQLCRVRKTKCNNARPKCRLCEDSGAECIYEDRADHSSFDPASLLMLERLNHIIERLDTITPASPPSASAPSPARGEPRHPQTARFAESSPPSEATASINHDHIDDEYLRIPSSRTTPDTILCWPIFEGQYPQDYLVETLFVAASEADAEDSSCNQPHPNPNPSHGRSYDVQEGNIQALVEKFITLVHIKNPILDVPSLRRHASPAAETIERVTIDGSMVGTVDGGLGARPTHRRVVLCSGAETHRTTGEWHYQGSVLLLVGGLPDVPSPAARSLAELPAGINNTSHVLESELRIELNLPESSIASIRYPDMFPSPPVSATPPVLPASSTLSLDHDANTPNSQDNPSTPNPHAVPTDQMEQESWYYYLTEIALRRIANRILNAFFKEELSLNTPIANMIADANRFEAECEQW